MERLKAQNWFAVYTRPRCEKKVHSRLTAQGIEAYCPLQKTLKQWSDRKKLVSVPLFTSYLFVRIDESQRQQVLNLPGVVGFVFWLNRPAIIKDEEIIKIKEFLEDYPSAELEPLDSGLSVLVAHGPFQNIKGTVVRKKRDKVVLQIEVLGRQIVAQLPQRNLVIASTKTKH